jgi:glucans biosynthesis protein
VKVLDVALSNEFIDHGPHSIEAPPRFLSCELNSREQVQSRVCSKYEAFSGTHKQNRLDKRMDGGPGSCGTGKRHQGLTPRCGQKGPIGPQIELRALPAPSPFWTTCHTSKSFPGGLQNLEINPMKHDETRPANLGRAPRCGARTRAGTPCQRSAMRDRSRCRLHGGLSPGAPQGSKNGNFKNGDWTADAIQERQWLRSLLRSLANNGTTE